jgi:hypothetical protein
MIVKDQRRAWAKASAQPNPLRISSARSAAGSLGTLRWVGSTEELLDRLRWHRSSGVLIRLGHGISGLDRPALRLMLATRISWTSTHRARRRTSAV